MKYFSPDHFNPLPKRSYDLNSFRSYPHFLKREEREEKPNWHCFAIFDEELKELVMKFLEEHDDCECYCKAIYEDDLIDEESINTTLNNRKEVYNVIK